VTDFLKHQMPPRVLCQRSDSPNPVEVSAMPVHVAGNHDLVSQFRRERDRAALPAGHSSVGVGRPIEGGYDVFDVLQRGNHDQIIGDWGRFLQCNM
jgi:hypothetical protein